ncbi:DUF2590 family protein [Pseudoalteromonas sp. CO348]|uniref:DUF2590 family protein n=1 Tax=Pseudoalteromonas sp. CO348 TaxID=1777271 RepID=UPI001023AD70|nr:DUF2590 family protein [Pseudoalteromonas sp. CO348]RZG05505.1 DUF2590 family protein [Pseudoalteromonas sp. CO348]
MIRIDLNIVDGDIHLDSLFNPSQINDRDVVAQDIKHRIIESKKLPLLIGLRNKDHIAKVLTEIELIVEQDDRLVPGTIKITQLTTGLINVEADTRDYGRIEPNGL